MYDCIIIGSGYASFGYALKNKNTLIIDSGELCDKYFCGCLNQGGNWKEDGVLSSEFAKYKLVYGGRVDVCALETIFSHFIAKNIPPLLMLTNTCSYKKTESGYELKVYNNNGFLTFEANRLIVNEPFDKTKYVSARVRGNEDGLKELFPDAVCERGFYDGEFFMRLKANSDSLAEEKMRIVEQWSKGKHESKIITIADVFMYIGNEKFKEDGGILYIDESAFDNADDAFCFGGEII